MRPRKAVKPRARWEETSGLGWILDAFGFVLLVLTLIGFGLIAWFKIW